MTLQEFTQAITPIKDKLYRLSFRIVGNRMEAEDVVQEVFIKLWRSRDHLDDIRNLEAWCVRVTKNLSIDKLRSAHSRTVQIPEGMDFKDRSSNPYRRTESNDTMERIQRMMDSLPDAQKMVMQLRDIEGYTYQEIADALELSLDQVRVYLHRARKKIRQLILQSESYGFPGT